MKPRIFCTPCSINSTVHLSCSTVRGADRMQDTRETIEQRVEQRLGSSGWNKRARAIVLDPEFECWVWSDSPEVDHCLGWSSRQPDLRTWLKEQDLWPADALKPQDPKKAFLRALREVGKSRSSTIFETLGQRVSLARCSDPAFNKLRETLQDWFPGKEPPRTGRASTASSS